MSVERPSYGILKRVQIEKMWNIKDIDINLEAVNLFVGINGSGKTTFIKIIESVSSFDVESIINLNFKKCVLYFDNNYHIICNKHIDKYDQDIVEYIIKEGELKLISKRIDSSIIKSKPWRDSYRSSYERYMKFFNNYDITDILNNILKISWISVDRSYSKDDYIPRDDKFNSIDTKAKQLVKHVQKYKSDIESYEKDVLENFRSKIFELMLYDENIDTIDNISTPSNTNWIIDLRKAFDDLGITSQNINEKIKLHVKTLQDAFNHINNDNDINMSKKIALPLFNRTQRIIKFSKEAESERKLIRYSLELYLKQIQNFIGKPIRGINMSEFSDEKGFAIHQLSSGEKQILILLSEALLQEQEKTLFIADEPELSLHISWQREIIGALRALNPNAQIIFATHSPEVVSKWQEHTINMENIVI